MVHRGLATEASPGGGARVGCGHHRDGHDDTPDRHEKPEVPDCRLDIDPLEMEECWESVGSAFAVFRR